MRFLLKVIGVLLCLSNSRAFTVLRRNTRDSLLPRCAAGMGMAQKTSSKRGKKSKSKKTNAVFDVNASISRHEKKYEGISLEAAKTLQKEEESEDDMVMSEFIVAARDNKVVTDWVPICQLCLSRTQHQVLAASEDERGEILQAAVSACCRELSHIAGVGSRVFQTVARNDLQYSVESIDSFHKHVYEVVIEGKNENKADETVMTKTDAMETLGLSADEIDKASTRQRYRKMSFVYHPDRFAGDDTITEAELVEISAKYSKIKLAYETLQSGIKEAGESWYESLGGKSRTDFTGPLRLLPIKEAGAVLDTSRIEYAVTMLDPNLVQGFVARSKA